MKAAEKLAFTEKREGHDFYSLREKSRFVSGHRFSDAGKPLLFNRPFRGCRSNFNFLCSLFQSCRYALENVFALQRLRRASYALEWFSRGLLGRSITPLKLQGTRLPSVCPEVGGKVKFLIFNILMETKFHTAAGLGGAEKEAVISGRIALSSMFSKLFWLLWAGE